MAASATAVVDLRTRDADRTRQEILRAAMEEFAERGLGGARIDSIAERAGVNKLLIYYYFGAKDELFLAVLERTYTDIREAERALHLEMARWRTRPTRCGGWWPSPGTTTSPIRHS